MHELYYLRYFTVSTADGYILCRWVFCTSCFNMCIGLFTHFLHAGLRRAYKYRWYDTFQWNHEYTITVVDQRFGNTDQHLGQINAVTTYAQSTEWAGIVWNICLISNLVNNKARSILRPAKRSISPVVHNAHYVKLLGSILAVAMAVHQQEIIG